ncbi:MAG TPA: glycoside hydrolase family 16 protein [Marmoricola sp.]|jgi:beta-glucanase (GH16 family)|nr:glycoside hydrolase family 16 protein [Marmoricola sp.]
MSRARLPYLVGGVVAMLVVVLSAAATSGSDVALAGSSGGYGTPRIAVLSAPSKLELHQAGLLTVSASAPARPGDTIYLQTTGAYSAGYVSLAQAVLAKNLTATLHIPGQAYLGNVTFWASLPAKGNSSAATSRHFPVTIVSPPPQHAPTCGGQKVRKANGTLWKCTYDDEFSGTTLDRRYWVPQKNQTSGYVGNRSTLACAVDSPSTIAVSGGALNLSLVRLAKRRDCGNKMSGQYAYGQVMHYQTYAQKYGLYEVRALIPDLKVKGAQQTFWLWPESQKYGPWPSSGEIDFAELYSSQRGIEKPFVHYLPGQATANKHQNTTHALCAINRGVYNTYGLDWEPGRLTIMLNGRVCVVDNYTSVVGGAGSAAPFDQPFYLILDQAMGTVGNIANPSTLPTKVTTKIDYVRIFS